ELAGSAYNERRAQCEAAVQALAALSPGIRALRDVDRPAFLRFGYTLDTVVGRRARHVVHEDARVLTAIAALEASDLATFGALMNESHESLRFDYEVSSRPLDVLVGAARQVEGCLGSRLTGAGFGGCTVSLVHGDAVPQFGREVALEAGSGDRRRRRAPAGHSSAAAGLSPPPRPAPPIGDRALSKPGAGAGRLRHLDGLPRPTRPHRGRHPRHAG